MAKLALLIGVSDYQPGLAPLPGAIKDIQAMQQVLQDSEIASFDDITLLSNPEPQTMQEAIGTSDPSSLSTQRSHPTRIALLPISPLAAG
jgi:hypothetical protein